MYAKSAHIFHFKCFEEAEIELNYPDKRGEHTPHLANVNLILGDNGAGKSSILRAIAIGMLAPVLMESGFVPFRLARRTSKEEAFLKVFAQLGENDTLREQSSSDELELVAKIAQVPSRPDIDRIHQDRSHTTALNDLVFDESSHAFFVVGYGATRRIEMGDFVPSEARQKRGKHYARVASLFEDHVALRPLSVLFEAMAGRKKEAVALMNKILPDEVTLKAQIAKDSKGFTVLHRNTRTPFSALSDGYRSFIAMIADLVGHLVEVCPKDTKLEDCPGIVLIDEIDLHLHPSWQRRVIADFSRGFPKLQFIFTSHSPLIVNSLQNMNVFLTEYDSNDAATIKQLGERTYGRGVDQILLSSFFGLSSVRPLKSVSYTDELATRAARGDTDAAIKFMEELGEPKSYPESSVPSNFEK